MKDNKCTSERFSKYFLSGLLGVFALGFAVLGLTFLPGIGFILALPVVALAVALIRTKFDDQCQLDFS